MNRTLSSTCRGIALLCLLIVTFGTLPAAGRDLPSRFEGTPGYWRQDIQVPAQADGSRRKQDENLGNLPEAALGPPEENPAYDSPGFGDIGPWLAGIAIAAVSIIVIRVIVDMLKQNLDGETGQE